MIVFLSRTTGFSVSRIEILRWSSQGPEFNVTEVLKTILGGADLDQPASTNSNPQESVSQAQE